MGTLTPVAFDIETSGLNGDAVITVAGFAHEEHTWLVLNTDGSGADRDALAESLSAYCETPLRLELVTDEKSLLVSLCAFVEAHVDSEAEYITAYNGETWQGGFDLPFLRSACSRHDVAWPFDDVAYADAMSVVERFNTNEMTDLVGVYDTLIGEECDDPFEESEEAVEAFENGDWESLLRHNLADIRRTRELAVLAGEYVPQSDFRMKNLAPPAP
jgi:uncharacterized protein YprB with RNaseH-like and TPR domain